MWVISALAAVVAGLWLFEASARAQQPFITDNAGVTPHATIHVEIASEFDVLQRSALPGLSQSTSSILVASGIRIRVEVAFSAPLIVIFNSADADPRRAAGVGDADPSLKYNFLDERAGSKRPAMALSFTVGLPTGSVSGGIGSGFIDYRLNVVAEKSLTEKTTLQANVATILSGNNVSGALGIQRRGTVITASLRAASPPARASACLCE